MTNQTHSPAVANAAEWQALMHGAGLADLTRMGRLHITGADALDLLNRLTTNKLETLPPGSARDTVVTNGNGRVVDFLSLAALPDRLLCLTSPGRAQTVIDWLDTYTFGEDITVADRSADMAQLALAGPSAVRVLADIGVADIPAQRDSVAVAAIAGTDVILWRTLPGGADGFHLLVDTPRVAAVRQALMDGGAMGVAPETWDAYRVCNGMPAYGAEFDESANPLEARLSGAISEDKGCYTGQEVIARLMTYRKVQRRLMAVDLDAPVAPGSELTEAAHRAGIVTSVAVLPDGRGIGLAMVSMKMAAPGRALEAPGGVRAVQREPAYALNTEPIED